MGTTHNPGEDPHSEEDNRRLLSEFPYPDYEQWRQLVEQQLKGAPFEKKMLTPTLEGITLQPIYRREDIEKIEAAGSLPGFSPFTRGSAPLGHTVGGWHVAQAISYPSPEDFHEALQNDIERGQDAVNMPLDLAVRRGKDPDSAGVEEVSYGGVSAASADDLMTALQGIDLSSIPFYTDAGSSALPFAVLLLAALQRSNTDPARLRGLAGGDPLAQFVTEGNLPTSLDQVFDEMAFLSRWAGDDAPGLKTIGVSDHPYNNAGASVTESLAFSLATAVEYLRQMESRGISVNDAASRVVFSLSVGPSLFMEIAKLRAARELWAQIIQAAAGNDSAQRMTIHVRTSSANVTEIDPYVNMLRTTGEAFAAVVGGCDSLHVGFFDQAVRQPDQFSRRIARNTQLILRHESHLDRIIDPAGGSYFIESLTNELAQKTWQLFQMIEKQGGMLKALASGFPQGRCSGTAAKRADAVAHRTDVLVGVNRYANEHEEPLESDAFDRKAFGVVRAETLMLKKATAEHQAAIRLLNKVKMMEAVSDKKKMQGLIEAAVHGATLGEIVSVLRKDASGGSSIEPLKPFRPSEAFERIRRATEAYRRRTGSVPEVFVASVGAYSKIKTRQDFVAEFFHMAGFKVIAARGYGSTEEAARVAIASSAPIVVICSTDEAYPDIVPKLTDMVRDANANTIVVVAGFPLNEVEYYRKKGVDDFIHVRADAVEVLTRLGKKLGVM